MSPRIRLCLALALLGIAACGGDLEPGGGDSGASGEDLGGDGGGSGGSPDVPAPGVSPGGAEDIAYARELIEQGQVPPGDVITVEGLLSEHDLPTADEPCESLLCSRPALGVAPWFETGEPAYWLHLGMATGLAADFERPPLDLVVGIDKSGSMSIDMAETTEAVSRMIAKLRPDDRIAVFAFDNAIHELHPLGPVEDADALVAQVRALQAEGGWDMQKATRHAYQIAAASPSEGRLERVMFLSCGYPAVSQDGNDEFSQLVTEHGAAGVGTSFFGVLLGYDGALADLLGRAHGGSYYYLEDLARVTEVFDLDFDLMVTPLAYDLQFALEVGIGFRLEGVHGVPGDEAGEPRAEIDVSTVFRSRRRGGVVARLSRVDPEITEIGEVTLSYTPEPALGWTEAEEQTAAIALPSNDEDPGETVGVRKAAFLVNQAEAMRDACDAFHAGDAAGARALLERLLAILVPEAEGLAEDAITAEVALVEKLLANMGAE
ncbi:MAG TPA: VWA domain-containing protein [Kofleriaceae bacterium]|nr:VWA domain-containing protein [Kofleriaceae bacterium]